MKRKKIFLIVGVITVIVTIGGIAGITGSLGVADEKQKTSTRLAIIYFSLTADFHIRLWCTTVWAGSWSIGDDGGVESGNSGTYDFYGRGKDAYIEASFITMGSFNLILDMWVNGIHVGQNSSVTNGEVITLYAESPNKHLLPLVFLV